MRDIQMLAITKKRLRSLIGGTLSCVSVFSLACGLDIPVYETDPSSKGTDLIPPSLPVVEILRISQRARPKVLSDGTIVRTSCDGIGHALIRVSEATDDKTPAHLLGYRIRVVKGETPEGSLGWAVVQKPQFNGNTLVPFWFNTPEVSSKPIDLWLKVTTIDKAGNESEPSKAVHLLLYEQYR